MLDNAHASYVANQSRPHRHSVLFRLFERADDGMDRFSGVLADKFSGASGLLSKFDYMWKAQVIPVHLLMLFDPKVWSGEKQIESIDVSETKSVGDLFHDMDFDNFPIPAVGDVLSQLQDHQPSDLITADFIKESIVNNDGFLHRWGIRLMGLATSAAIGAVGGAMVGAVAGPMLAGLVGMMMTVGFARVAYNKEGRKEAALGPTIAQLNSLTGHGDGTSVDADNALNEFIERMKTGGLSASEAAGARAYFDDEERGRVGESLSDMGSRPLAELHGYRWAMGVATALGAAAAAKTLMEKGGLSGNSEALSGGNTSGAGTASGTASGTDGAVAVSAGNVSVRSIRANMSEIVREIMGNRGALAQREQEIGRLQSAMYSAMQDTSDSSMLDAIRQLDDARQKLASANEQMLGYAAQAAQQFSNTL